MYQWKGATSGQIIKNISRDLDFIFPLLSIQQPSLPCVAIYLPRRSDVRVHDMIEVFVNSVQQPKEELLGVVLGVTSELKGHSWTQHSAAQKKNTNQISAHRSETTETISHGAAEAFSRHRPIIKYSVRLTGMTISTILKVSGGGGACLRGRRGEAF